MAKHDGGGRPQLDRDMMHRLLDHLIDLREATDPDTCAAPHAIKPLPKDKELLQWLTGGSAEAIDAIATNTGKHKTSKLALIHMMELMDQCCGWSLDHIAGFRLAINDEKDKEGGTISYIPFDPNGHDVESLGSEFRTVLNEELRGAPSLSTMRAFLDDYAEILKRSTHLNPLLWGALQGSLRALDKGEQTDLVKPNKTGRKSIKWTHWNWKTYGAKLVRFLQGYGWQRQAAEDRVASAFGETWASVNAWIESCGGKIEGAWDSLDQARRAGEIYKYVEDGGSISEFPDHERRLYYSLREQLRCALSMEALRAEAAPYRQHFKQKK